MPGTECSWFGITCDNNITVKQIDLSFNQLTDSIPAELGNLTNLNFLYLTSNHLAGGIPTELMNLTGLSFLDICYNNLYTDNPDLSAFLDSKQGGRDWESCQIACSGDFNCDRDFDGFDLSTYIYLLKEGLDTRCVGLEELAATFGSILAAAFLYDDFSGNIVSCSKWHIPTWVSQTDGTFVGRTQFRCTQNSSLPQCRDSSAIILLETYNPTGYSFYGTDLISNQSFPLGTGIHITVRAKMDTSMPGIVGGIFLYALKPGSTKLHDEIDFELLTNRPDEVQTNIYGNEPLGAGHSQFVYYPSGSITDFHTYEIKWQPNQVSWFIDGNLVRTETNTEIIHVPTGPMNFHLNIWAPGPEWSDAYDSTLQPTTSSSSNQIYSMSVDSVNIESITPAPGMSDSGPTSPPLFLDKTQ